MVNRANELGSPEDSDGAGARSRALAVISPQHRQGTSPGIDLQSEEESQLITASDAFGNQTGPFVQPAVPQSVPPSTYHMGAVLSSYVSPQTSNQPAMGGYRGSFSSSGSRTSGWHSANTRPVDSIEPSLQISRIIQARILTAIQYIRVSPGINNELATRHQQILQEIGQLIGSALQNLRIERDAAIHDKDANYEKFKRALYDETIVKEQRDKLQADLKLSIEREKSLKNELEICEGRVQSLRRQLGAIERDATLFQEHHTKVTDDWTKQDDRHFKQIISLETEIKRLRARNCELAEKAGVPKDEASVAAPEFPSPSVPESVWNANAGSSRNAKRVVKSGLDPKDAADLLARLRAIHNITDDDEKESDTAHRPSTFKPNPKAPAWTPGESKTRKDGPKTPQKPNTESVLAQTGTRESANRTPVGGPSNWPALVPKNKDKGKDIVPRSASRSQAVEKTPVDVTRGNAQAKGKTPEVALTAAGPSRAHPRATQRTTIARDKEQWELEDIHDAIEHLYGLTKGYVVNCHSKKDEAPKVANNMLEIKEPSTWFYMLSLLYHDPVQAANHLSYLLSIPVYRPYLVMRIALDYIFKKMISPQVFLGFSSTVDKHLSALQGQIMSFNQPGQRSNARARQRVVAEHARIIFHALKDKNMARFRYETIERHTQMMAMILQPLRSKMVTDEEAIKSLRIVTSVTWEITTKIWTSGMTMHYTFPDCAAKYSFGTMDAINGRQMASSPEELQFSQTRISFVISPILSLRDERDEGQIKCHALRKAEVLVMK
ncbi:hypothetical protein AAE478_005825 [Parahypoxylon ruwenzoriense]